MLDDNWLDRWLPTILGRAGGGCVLEIGCGDGADTATLAKAGLSVIAFDLSEEGVRQTRKRVPSAFVECRDVRDPFPDAAVDLGAVVASLSLHYFPWEETRTLVSRIRQVLRPDGVLLCRLNSTEDKNFGATGHPEIEPSYYLVDGSPKRFFDEQAVRELFAQGWTMLSLEHFTTRKYVLQKALWEVVVSRDSEPLRADVPRQAPRGPRGNGRR